MPDLLARARRDRRRPRGDPCTTRGCCASIAGVPLMAVVKADGYGHGMVEVARAAREGGAEWLGVAALEEALALRAAGDTGRAAVLAGRARRGLRPGCSPPTSTSLRTPSPSSTRSPPRRRRDAARPAASSRSTPACPAAVRRARDWADAVRAAPEARGGGQLVGSPGIWSHFACSDEPDHPANDAAGGGLPRGARAGRRPPACAPRSGTSRTPRPRSCARRARFDAGPLRHRVVRSRPGPGADRRPRPGAGDDGARPAGDGQGPRCRATRSPTATLDRRPAHDRRPGPGRVRRRHPARRVRSAAAPAGRRSRGRHRRQAAADPGRVCMDQFVVDLGGDRPRGRRRGRAVRAAGRRGSPPRRTGPRRAAPSPTRSSPGSAAGCAPVRRRDSDTDAAPTSGCSR